MHLFQLVAEWLTVIALAVAIHCVVTYINENQEANIWKTILLTKAYGLSVV